MDNNFDILEQAIRNLSQGQMPEGPSDELVRRTLERVEQVNVKANPFVERIYKMKPLSKFAAAAIVVVSISLLFLFNSGPQNVALADVYSKVQQVHAFMYKMSMTLTGAGTMISGQAEQGGTMQMEMAIIVSEQYGMKIENHTTISGKQEPAQSFSQFAYLLPEQKVMVSIIPERKMYQTIEFTEDLLKQTQQQNNDPRQTIRQMLEHDYVELGREEINGVQTQVFQTTDPAFSGGIAKDVTVTLWVDARTWLPVRYEAHLKMNDQMEGHYVIDQFQWDLAVQASDFEYEIPADYKEFGNIKMPEMNEQAAIGGLRTYLQFFGYYPENLDLVSVMSSLKKLKDVETEYARQFREKMESAGEDQAKMQEFTQEFMMPIQSLLMFHMQLVQQKKDPAYYGDRVTPEDTDAVLMRWKTDSGKYMVVFGDLSSVEMEYEDMIKIEPPSEPQDTAVPQ